MAFSVIVLHVMRQQKGAEEFRRFDVFALAGMMVCGEITP
jgi:hypothetical protein